MFKNFGKKWNSFCSATRSRLTGSRSARILGWVAGGVFVFFLYFFIEMYNYRSPALFFRFIRLHPKSALLGLLITAVIYCFLLLLTKKAWLGALSSTVLFQIAGLVNFYKVSCNGDPFVPWDFSMTGNLGQLLEFAKIRLPWWVFVMALAMAAYIFVMWLWQRTIPLKWYIHIPTSLIFPLMLVLFLRPSAASGNFAKFGISYQDAFLQSSNYRANGFVAGFCLNIATMSVEQPENYSQETATAVLADYTATRGEKDPDIIVILCETYWDVRKLTGTEFSTDPMYFYDELCARDNAYSGTLYTTALGGGTVRTEFGVLTGLSTDFLPAGTSPYIYAKNNLSSIASTYKNEGYTTIAMHPYDKSFYTRNIAYPYMGFDMYYGQSEIEEMVDVTYQRGYVSDDSFVDAIIAQLEENASAPVFLWGISMENHQSYKALPEYEITVKNDALNEEVLASVNTYAQGVYHSTMALEKLVNYIDSREKDTLLVFFGDHLPTLGTNYEVYKALGMYSDESNDTEARKVLYGTPFVIYANYELERGYIDNTGNELSDYYLMSIAAKLGGTTRSSYMNWLLEQYQTVPYYNPRLDIAETQAIKVLRQGQKLITYDRLVGEDYTQE